jgi:hypothetical protein
MRSDQEEIIRRRRGCLSATFPGARARFSARRLQRRCRSRRARRDFLSTNLVCAFRTKPEPLFLRRIAPGFVIPPAGADVCFTEHANNVGGALVPRPGLILHQATKAKGLSVSLFGLRCSQPIRQVFRPVPLRRGFVRCSR